MNTIASLSPLPTVGLGLVSTHSKPAYDPFKRAFDVLTAVVLLTFLSPLLLLIIVLVRLSSPGCAVFRQQRLTKGGKVFTMYKFRTMCIDAESKSGAVFASANDPRITAIGKFLRRTRLDELPQLANVLLGDMSLVGPRPERPELLPALVNDHPLFEDRLRVVAGLTGLAQVCVGYSASPRQYRHKLACDRLYVQHRSAGLDMWILFKTVAVVWTGKGAV